MLEPEAKNIVRKSCILLVSVSWSWLWSNKYTNHTIVLPFLTCDESIPYESALT